MTGPAFRLPPARPPQEPITAQIQPGNSNNCVRVSFTPKVPGNLLAGFTATVFARRDSITGPNVGGM